MMNEYDDQPIWDLMLIDSRPGLWIFQRDDGSMIELPAQTLHAWRDDDRKGLRGVAFPLEGHPGGYRFQAYLDQSLKRMPELDAAKGFRLGWSCDARPDGFNCPAWVVPGEGGQFVEDETQPVTVNVPPEFASLCDELGRDVEDVLRAFMADAAGIMNWVRCPRADGCCSNGSDERMMAIQYLERCYR